MYVVSRRSGFAHAYLFRLTRWCCQLRQTVYWGYYHEILCYRKSASSWWIFLFCVWVHRSISPSSFFCTFWQLKPFAEKVEDSLEASPVSLVFHKLERQPWSYAAQFVCRRPGWAGKGSSLLLRGFGSVLLELNGFVSLHLEEKWTDQIPKQKSPQWLDSTGVYSVGGEFHPRWKTDRYCHDCTGQTHHIFYHVLPNVVQRTD